MRTAGGRQLHFDGTLIANDATYGPNASPPCADGLRPADLARLMTPFDYKTKPFGGDRALYDYGHFTVMTLLAPPPTETPRAAGHAPPRPSRLRIEEAGIFEAQPPKG